MQRLLKQGLPVIPASADAALLDLRGIVARAVDPADAARRTVALDGMLRGLLARFPDARYASAARALFGLPPAKPGQNLTVRRELVAKHSGHEVHHFRKRVESKLIEKVASSPSASNWSTHPAPHDRLRRAATATRHRSVG